jgi:hypothetical protein
MATALSKIWGNISNQAVVGQALFDYYLNDPSTPNLTVKMGIWGLPGICPPFKIVNWSGQVGGLGSYEAQCCQIHNTVAITLEYVQKSFVPPVARWAANNQLLIFPRAGQDFNAYYDRSSLRFFFAVDPETGKTVYTCESSDIVAHELGHALLDAIRPDLWNVSSLEVFAFHESFSDLVSLLKALQHDELMEYVIHQTKGNLEIPNIISGLAEELGAAIRRGPINDPLRNALNHFIYSPPESLPDTRDDNQLGRGPHSFSRVFTGACYDILVQVYNLERISSPAVIALRTARDVLTRLLLNALPIAPVSPRFYASVAQAMISVDKLRHQGRYVSAIAGSFAKRKIYHMPIAMLHQGLRLSAATPEIEKSLLAEDVLVSLPRAVPKKNLFGSSRDEVAVNSATSALKFLKEQDSIGEDKLFAVDNNELVRKRICWHSQA